VNSDVRDKDFREAFKRGKCCVVIPTYNNAAFLGDMIDDVQSYCSDLIVVNDGSTDHTPEILSRYGSIHPINFPVNQGKGAALKAGFKHALELGFHHAVTLDSDSQHSAADLPGFLELLEAEPGTFVIGSRILNGEQVPRKNRFANRFSNFWFRIATGLKLKDTQSGYRLYPIRALSGTKLFSGRYEFELEALVKAAWKGIRIVEQPIRVHYPPEGKRVSHFRPLLDFLRISLLNVYLIFLGLTYFRPRMIFLKYRGKSLKQILREDIIRSDTPRHIIALSIAFGIFMGIFPVWGYQLMIGFFLAHLMKLNKAIFFIAANISIPPMIPAILYLSYVTGSYVLGEGSWKVDIELNLWSIGENLKQYLTGSMVFATIAGSFLGVLSYTILLLIKRSK
jgi:glycosyltransferase involved in cell wall biosynthesis